MSNWDRPYNLNNWTDVVLCKIKGNKFHSGIMQGKKEDQQQF